MAMYNPVPPRAWSRVQSQCTYVTNAPNDLVYVPVTNQIIPRGQADLQDRMWYKGNILQYKGNSAQLTKTQKYAQLAVGGGPNRRKVCATQTQSYTNPNVTGLCRVGYTTYTFPNQIVGAPNNVSGPFQYNVTNDCGTTTVQDGGTLVCGCYANPCTDQVIIQAQTDATVCAPTAASNVPGPGVLCWNNKLQTFFPRQRVFMNNSTDKWPQGYKGFVSALRCTSPPFV